MNSRPSHQFRSPVARVYTPIYTVVVNKKVRAKLFRNGGSQAVRLPKECRFSDAQREVMVHREGRAVVIEPVDEWPDEFRACLGAWRDDIPRPKQRRLPRARNPFD
jgi:antitoxin VapB